MKIRLLVAMLLWALAAGAPVGSQSQDGAQERERERPRHREHQTHESQPWVEQDLPERDEIRQTLELAPGATVEVSAINGSVELETANIAAAELHIVRSARDRADLEYHKIIIEHSPNRLVVRGEKDPERRSTRGREVRQRVTMKIPRQVDLRATGINGRVTVGAVDGPVRLDGINGRVEVAQATGYSDISGINGRVEMTIAALGPRGLSVRGINGGVELKFTEDLNADLDVSGVNGSVSADMPNVTIQGKLDRSNFRARIGAGGSPISVSGVNGRVRLSRVGATG
jgi:hypothetical protein